MKRLLLSFLILALLVGCSSRRRAPRLIRIESQGVELDGSHLTDKMLRDALLKDFANYGSTPVLLVSAADCPFGRMEQTLDVLGSAGIWDVRFSLTGGSDGDVRFSPAPLESVHVPWHEVTAFISGKDVSTTTNSEEVIKSGMGRTGATHVRFNATPVTIGQQLFAHLWTWQSQGARMTRDKEIGSNKASQTGGTPAPQPER